MKTNTNRRLTTDQFSQHLLCWLDEPAQAALKAEGGDAVEMCASDAATPEQVRWLEAFAVLWDHVDAKENEKMCNAPSSSYVRFPIWGAAKRLGLTPCGLNADWSVQAWHLGDGEPNRQDGDLYLLDMEDGHWEIVSRHYLDGGNDEIKTLARGEESSEGLAWLEATIAAAKENQR